MSNIFHFTQKRNIITRPVVHILLHSALVQKMKLSKRAQRMNKSTMLLGVTRKSAEGIFEKLNCMDLIEIFDINEVRIDELKNFKQKGSLDHISVPSQVEFNHSGRNTDQKQSISLDDETQQICDSKTGFARQSSNSRTNSVNMGSEGSVESNSNQNDSIFSSMPDTFHYNDHLKIPDSIPNNLIGHVLHVLHNQNYFLALFIVETEKTFMVLRIGKISKFIKTKIQKNTPSGDKIDTLEPTSRLQYNYKMYHKDVGPIENARILVLLKHNTIILTSKEYLLGECCSIKRVT